MTGVNYDPKYIENVSTYNVIERVDLSDSKVSPQYVILLELKLSNGNVNDTVFYSYGNIIKTNKMNNIYFNNSFKENIENNFYKTIYFDENNLPNQPLIGRGLLFRLYDNSFLLEQIHNAGKNIFDYDNEKDFDIDLNDSLISYLGWGIQNLSMNSLNERSRNLSRFGFKSDYRFIHSNTDFVLLNSIEKQLNNPKDYWDIIINPLPTKNIPIENYNGIYYLKSIPFIFIKIIPSGNTNSIGGLLLKTNTLGMKECYIKNINKNPKLQNSSRIYTKNN